LRTRWLRRCRGGRKEREEISAEGWGVRGEEKPKSTGATPFAAQGKPALGTHKETENRRRSQEEPKSGRSEVRPLHTQERPERKVAREMCAYVGWLPGLGKASPLEGVSYRLPFRAFG
jgi:hypothetical protein